MPESSHARALAPSAQKQDYTVSKDPSQQPDRQMAPNPKLEKQVARLKGYLGIANDCLDIPLRARPIIS